MPFTGDFEIERKFDVGETTQLPPLHQLPGVDRVEGPVEHQLDATYFDTADLALAARGMTLRRRTGGEDAGWHLKLPVALDMRREIRESLAVDPNIVPQPFLLLLRVHIRDRVLIPVARLRTRRIVHRLRDVHGEVLADFCDDRVQADRLGPDPANLTWREWELEVADGSTTLLDAAQSMLAIADVLPSAHPSKLARVLGDKYPEKEPPATWGLKRNCPSANVLLAYVNEQVQVLTEQDPRVRLGSPDSVHLMRIATRRLRSALSTYRILLDADLATRLRAELQWLGGILGAHRDAEVMHERLAELIAAESTELILGPMLRRVNERLETDSRNARLIALEALEDKRYFRLLDGLEALMAAPPLTDLASISERKIVPKLVKTEWKRLRRAIRTAVRTPAGLGHNQALHEVRKSAKRLRYAAETATPLRRKRATRIAGAAEKIQTILGDHQDSVLAQGLLRNLGMEAHLQGENVFSYGRLNALEQRTAEKSEIQFRQAWDRFPSASLKK